MRFKKIKNKKGVNFNCTQTQSKYVISTILNYQPYLCFVGVEGVVKPMLVWLWSNILRKWGITRTFLICPTKTSNDIFKNLKTLDEKKDVCDNENRCKVSLQNIIQEVKKDWKQFEDALKYAKVYKNF